MDTENEQNLRDEDWQNQTQDPGGTYFGGISEEAGYAPDPEDSDGDVSAVELDHQGH